jgi:hypothetical protein
MIVDSGADLLGILLGNNMFKKKKDLEFSPKSLKLYGGDDETRTRDLPVRTDGTL